jgi:hypothetical protein
LASIHPALATRSGASPRIGIYSPGVGDTLGGFASHWHFTLLILAAFYIINGVPSATSTSVRQQHRLQQAFDHDIAYSKPSTTSSP